MSQQPRPLRANRLAVIMIIAVASLSVGGCASKQVVVSLLQLRPGTDTDLQGPNQRSLLDALLDPCHWQTDSDRARTDRPRPCQSSHDSPAMPRIPGQMPRANASCVC